MRKHEIRAGNDTSVNERNYYARTWNPDYISFEVIIRNPLQYISKRNEKKNSFTLYAYYQVYYHNHLQTRDLIRHEFPNLITNHKANQTRQTHTQLSPLIHCRWFPAQPNQQTHLSPRNFTGRAVGKIKSARAQLGQSRCPCVHSL